MSIYYYVITEKEIPLKVIAQSVLMHYPLENVTRYVKDSKPGYIYYLCGLGVTTSSKDIENYERLYDALPFSDDTYGCEYISEYIYRFDYIPEYQFFNWCVQELYNLGPFKFINVWEDNTKCGTGYHEDFFSRCNHIEIDFNNFKKHFESKDSFNKFQRNSEDILYIIEHG